MKNRGEQMFDAEILRGYFQESSMVRLHKMMEAAKNAESEAAISALNGELVRVLEQEASQGMCNWFTSPSGNQHIVIKDCLCIWMNIHGGRVLFKDYLIEEGEMAVRCDKWFEEDHLVLLDIFYIVHDEWRKCICHYAQEGFFAYFTPCSKM